MTKSARSTTNELRNTVLIFSFALLVAGCGGGGGGSSTTAASSAPAASPQLQGFYQGTSSNGKTVDALILEDGSWWDLYGVASGTALVVQGVATGTSIASNGNFTITFSDFYAPGTSPVSGTGSGTYTGTTILGTQTESGVNGTFNLTVPATTNYNYNTAANLSSITGTWAGGLLDGESANVSILANGTLTATSSLGCSATGTVAPRASGKNVFNVSLTFGAAPCAQPNQTVSGIAVTYPLGNGTNQLVVGLVNSSQTEATAFVATNAALSCASGSGRGTNGIRLYDPSNLFSFNLSTTSANALDSVTTGWGAAYTGVAGSYTGSLVASLWAVTSSYSGGTIVGTFLGNFVPNFTGAGAYSSSQIAAGGYSLNTITSSAAEYNPPAGQYCLVLTLEEYAPGQCASAVNSNITGLTGYCIADWLQFNNTVIFQ